MADNGRHHDRRWADISSDEEAELDMYDRQEMMTRLAIAENGNFSHDHFDLSSLRRAASGSGSSFADEVEVSSASRQDGTRWSDQVSEAEEEAAAMEQEEARRNEVLVQDDQPDVTELGATDGHEEEGQAEPGVQPPDELDPADDVQEQQELAQTVEEDTAMEDIEASQEEEVEPQEEMEAQQEVEEVPVEEEEEEEDEEPVQAEREEEEPSPSAEAALQSHRKEVLKDALELAKKLRALAAAEEAANPPVRTCEQACQTDLQAEDVLRMEAVRERLLKRRRVQEEQEQGGLASREAQLEAKRKKVEKVRGELAEAQKAQQARQRQQTQEIANLEREIRDAEARLAEPLEEVDETPNQVLRTELQSLQAENQATLQAVQRVRDDEKAARKEIEDLEKQVSELQAKLDQQRRDNHTLEQDLAASLATVIQSQSRLAELEEHKRVAEDDLEEENRLAKEDWNRQQELEDEIRSLTGALRQTEEAKAVWTWRLDKVIKQIEKLDHDSIFVRRLLEAGAS